MVSLYSFLYYITNFRNPLLRAVVPTVAAIVGIQTAVAVPSIAYQTERFYDASGATTFLVASLLSLRLPTLRAAAQEAALVAVGPPNWRQTTITSAVSIWAATLGYYLFERILVTGKDSRFDKIKTSPQKFALAWFGQSVWIILCLMPVMVVNAVSPHVLASSPVRPWEIAGIAAVVVGYALEMTANWQKRRWLMEKMNKKHEQAFMTSGLFAKCQYPNYTGDMTFWCGIATMALGALWPPTIHTSLALPAGLIGRAAVAGLSLACPGFVCFILTKVSGIPLTEKSYDAKYGHREDYQAWKQSTPRLLPRLF